MGRDCSGYRLFADFFGGKHVAENAIEPRLGIVLFVAPLHSFRAFDGGTRLKSPKTTKAQKEMLDYYAAKNEQSREARKLGPRPAVGIFFLYENRLLVEGTPVKEAQPYGEFMGHSNGHPNFWRNLQRNKIVPQEVEYDEVPRGRVGYQTKEGKFYVFLDPCILANQKMVDQIKRKLNLPSADTVPPTLDAHYHCPGCKKKTKEQLEEEQADWDF